VKDLSRRQAIQLILATTTVAAMNQSFVFGADAPATLGFDPDLLKKEIPWPRLLTKDEKETLSQLVDLLIPADEHGPAASEVGVVDFLDEWISAPYPSQLKDRDAIREGVKRFDALAQQRHKQDFRKLDSEQQTALLEAIATNGTEENKRVFSSFKLIRDRAAAGYYTTREGWKAIGYVGNMPIAGNFPAPTPEALKHAGLL
jgi:hypothetical protein